MGRLIGIDLGTTNSVVAVDDGEVRALANADGDLFTKSAVGVRPYPGGKTRLIFGREAVEWAEEHPRDVIMSITRLIELIGRSRDDPISLRLARAMPYEVFSRANKDKPNLIEVVLGERRGSIELGELASELLIKLKTDAEASLGEQVTHATISVPARFSLLQRRAVEEAARLAGLEVLKILDETTAAAIAFGLDSSEAGNEAKTILVYDLGGGSFDIAILVMGGGSFVTLNLEGDMWLGGDNFDEKLMELAVARCQEKYGIDPTNNKRFMAQLKQSAREAKERLSSSQSTDISVVGCLESDDGNIIDVEVEVTRNRFEELIRPMVESAEALVSKALANANLTVDDIDAVLMAGNSTAVPLIQETIEKRFGAEKLVRDIQPKLCVAFGAAIAAKCIGCRIVCQASRTDDPATECGHINEPGALHCANCGASLGLADRTELELTIGLPVESEEWIGQKIEDEHVYDIQNHDSDDSAARISGMVDTLEGILHQYGWAVPADQSYSLTKKAEEVREALRSGPSAEAAAKANELSVLLNELPSLVSALISIRGAIYSDVLPADPVLSASLLAELEAAERKIKKNDPEGLGDLTLIIGKVDRIGGERQVRKTVCRCGTEVPLGVRICPGCGYDKYLLGASRDTEAQSAANSFSQEVPGSIDRVHFSVTAPPEVRPGDSFVVDIWAHLEKGREAVIERAQAGSPQGRILVKSKGPVPVARGTVLSVNLRLDDLIVEPAEETILWDGEIGNADFSVIVPKDKAPGPLRGLAQIYANGLRIANINFIMVVGDRTQRIDRISSEVRLLKTAFASYASEDRDMVMTFIQGVQKMNPAMNIFLDVLSLRSGQLWEQELRKVIPEKDVFYLFWSRHAAHSQWVEKEWRCGLETRGITFIDPVPFVSPEIVPPPTELAKMHFNDWVLAYRRFENLHVSQ